MTCKSSRLTKNLSSFDVCLLDTTKKYTSVITSLSLIQLFVEHLDTGYNGFLSFFFDTNDFYFIIQVKSTSLYTTSSNSTTTCDREYVLYRHYEWLICVTLWIWNILVDCVHQFHDSIAPFAVWIFQSAKSGTFDDWAICEVILLKLLCYFHLYEFDQLFVIYHITFVQEYNDIWYTYLTRQKDVLFCLSHNTVSSSYYKDSAVHLSSTSDHVLNVVSMARAVNVSIVTSVSLILNVSGVDRDTTSALLGSLIDVGIVHEVCVALQCQILGDSGGQSGLAVVNVTDGADVNMRLRTVKFCLFSHWNILPL